MIKYYKEIVDRELLCALAGRICCETASGFLGKRFCDTGYFSYFTLSALFDKQITLRFAFVCGGRRKTVTEKLTGADVSGVIGKPKIIDKLAKRYNAKRVIVSLSAPDGYDTGKAYEIADNMYRALKHAELCDFVLTDRGATYSLITSLKGGG